MARLTFPLVLLFAFLAVIWAPVPRPHAQPLPATLIADSMSYDAATGVLTASGDVEVLYERRVLRARRIVYDERAGEVRATGPIVLTDPEGGVLLADAAALSPDLSEGLIRGARLLIADQLQIAAAEIRRSEGRYNTLHRTVASTCTICAGNPTPTWAVRASRVRQDAQERRIYFEDARVEAFGLPIGYLPRFSIPDPSVERASGLLVPSIQQSNIYGLGMKVPYYFVLGPAADATLTPFLTTGGAVIFEGEYRRRFASGGFDLSGVLALDDGLAGSTRRGAFTAQGAFSLPRDFDAEFDLNIASDDSFLQQFDYSDADRLTSTALVSRTRASEYVELGSVAFQSLREDENTGSVPFILPDFTYRRLFDLPGRGGRVGVDADALGVLRATGRDMLRAGGGADWRRHWTMPNGLLLGAGAQAEFDLYRVWDQPGEPDASRGRASPGANIDLRWPFARASSGGAMHVIEPVAQLVYSRVIGADDVPNEDSQLPEFDETNLFSLNRFPGRDRLETGLRANLGINYTRYDPAGWSMGVTLGQVVRSSTQSDFSRGSGLAGRNSDLVGAVSVDFVSGLTLVNRALFGTDFEFRRNEFAMAYDGARIGLRTSYVFLAADDSNPILGPQPETSEFGIDARYRFHPNWELRGLWRYDLADNSSLRAGGGLTYGNQCAEIDLRVSRRYTSSANVPPSTSLGLNVRLAGIGEDGERDWPAESCAAYGI